MTAKRKLLALLACACFVPVGALAGTVSGVNGTLDVTPVGSDAITGAPCVLGSTPTCAGPAISATSTNGSTTITTGGTFQTLLAPNSARKGCLIQNPSTASEPLYVSVGVATGSAATAKSYTLAPGASFNCASGGVVVTDNIAVEAATTAHAFVETGQ